MCNKQSRQPIRGGPPIWGLGEGQTTLQRKKEKCSESFTQDVIHKEGKTCVKAVT